MAKTPDASQVAEKVNEERELVRERLFDMRDQLIDQIRELSNSSLKTSRQAGEEMADIGSDDFMREMELHLVGEEEKTFRLIQDALERVQDGSYGVCIDCEGPISNGRLKAIPYSKLCVDCKSQREMNNGYPAEEYDFDPEELVE